MAGSEYPVYGYLGFLMMGIFLANWAASYFSRITLQPSCSCV